MLMTCIIISCTTQETNPTSTTTAPSKDGFHLTLPENSLMKDKHPNVLMIGNKIILNLDEYFTDPLKIDSIGLNSDKIKHTFFLDERRVELDVEGEMDFLSNLTFRAEGVNYDLILNRVNKSVPVNMPGLNFIEGNTSIMKIGFTKKPTGVMAYWENYRIPTTIEDGFIKVTVPSNAIGFKHSKVKIYAHDDDTSFIPLNIDLKNGIKK